MNSEKIVAISAEIIAFVQNGATLEEAFKYALGPGYYDCLVDDLYRELRVKAGILE